MLEPISREEVRVRLDAARKVFPLRRISKLAKFGKTRLKRFIEGKPQKYYVGPMRLRRLHRICIDIETGALRWNGKRIGSEIWRDEPNKPPLVVHRILFDGKTLALRKGTAPKNDTMPSFSKLFGAKPMIQLPNLVNKGIKL